MKGNGIRFGARLVGLIALAWGLVGHAAKPARRGIPLPTDWSHRHLIFSRPGTAEQRAQVESDPRYWQQMHRLDQRILASIGTSAIARFLPQSIVRIKARRLHRDWAETMGTGASVGPGNFPAKFSFDSTTARCDSDPAPDFVVFSTGLQSSASTQASIVAFDNLYSGCTGTVPLPYWAYDTTGAAAGTVKTSPVPSLDGSQFAFVQTDGAGHGTLVLLRWAKTGRIFNNPSTPTLITVPNQYPGCTAPCMIQFDLIDGLSAQTDDTTSSVYYDYTNDVAWVGDNQGWLHKFTPVFKGTPSEVRTGGFPVQMPAGSALTSPVYDRISKSVFVGDQAGFLNRVDASTAAVTQSGQLDFAPGVGIVDAPMVDVTRGQVYASASDDGSTGCAGGADCAALYQLSANFVAGDTGTEAVVGTATFAGTPLPNPLYDGTIDNAYLNSADGTGNFYVCGNTGANPILYDVPIHAGVLGTPAILGTLAASGSNPSCSPVADFSIPGATAGSAATEHLFVSVQGNSTACGGGGCIQNLNDTPWQATTSFTVGQEILVESSNPLLRFINVVITAGTTGAIQPIWPNTNGVIRPDGSVVWLNQGNPAAPIAGWLANHAYGTVGTRILDANGNVQVVRTTVAPHKSGGTQPTWNTTPGGFTADNDITWVNAGALPINALASAGGTSGIIIDNAVGPGTLAGASQVYFSTLANQACGTSGNGGCAVQASQSGLQ